MKVILSFLFVIFLTGNSFAFLDKFFERHSSENQQCPIKLYNPNDASFTGVKLYANAETFHPLLEILSDYAKRCQVKINIKRSFIQENIRLKNNVGNMYTPVAFYLGEAIDINLVDKNNKVICNRSCMGKNLSDLKHVPSAICFLRKISQNKDLEQDSKKRTIIMKQKKSSESSFKQDEQRKMLQNKCKNLNL